MSPFARFTSWYWQLANALRSGIGELVIVQGIFKGSIVLNRDQIIAGMYHSSSRTIDSKGGGWKLKLPPTCCFCHLSNERIK